MQTNTNKGLKILLITLFIIFVVLPTGVCGTIVAIMAFGKTVEDRMAEVEEQELQSNYESAP